MSATLDSILAATRERVRASRASADVAKLNQLAEQHIPRGFHAALTRTHAAGRPAIIAELKKASPSKGLIRADFQVATLAKELEQAGATALSVLTDEKFFQGSLQNLELASQSTTLPCLRKDFIIDEFQVLEARAHRADAVLLIVAALSSSELNTFAGRARELSLDVLCEVHDETELERALAAKCDLIGVNSRDLKTFKVNPETLFRLAPKIPAGVLRVAESGIRSGEEMRRLTAAGYQAFLIGESLMRAPSPDVALQQMMAEYRSAPAHAPLPV
ncbi:MAG TPA: indole-3-glycerol phosphate synthase TrpC [Terriglobales bacterium]|nr:indole-3-glycerol phosphate synthase TrpC [Terriglobales bacterium]